MKLTLIYIFLFFIIIDLRIMFKSYKRFLTQGSKLKETIEKYVWVWEGAKSTKTVAIFYTNPKYEIGILREKKENNQQSFEIVNISKKACLGEYDNITGKITLQTPENSVTAIQMEDSKDRKLETFMKNCFSCEYYLDNKSVTVSWKNDHIDRINYGCITEENKLFLSLNSMKDFSRTWVKATLEACLGTYNDGKIIVGASYIQVHQDFQQEQSRFKSFFDSCDKHPKV